MKKWFVTCLGVVALGVLGGCHSKQSSSVSQQADRLVQIKKDGVIKIGTEGVYSPYTYHDPSGKLVGYDVEVAEKVAQKLGVKAKFIESKWDSLIAGLDAGRFDTVANQVNITPEREKKYTFSTPYTYIYGVLITKKGNDSIKDFSDIKGKKAANTLTSNWGERSKELGAEVVPADSFAQTIDLITSNRADATLNDNVAFLDYVKQHPDAPIEVKATYRKAQKTAFPVLKRNIRLQKAINQAVKELADEGVLAKLSEKYFGKDVSGASK